MTVLLTLLQVKNKLDGQLYAIKRILLNPSSKHFSERKITREVSLLSKLHHENIVRYVLSSLDNCQKAISGNSSD